jgi:preprotein translocase, secY subunit
MWLGEQITERGIGNGISLIITAGIAAGIPSGIARLLALTSQGSIGMPTAVSIVIGALLLIYIVVYFESAQRKVPVHYAKRQVGSGVMQGSNTHMPFKLNMAGVIPPIFASSIILFPSTLLSWFGSNDTGSLLHKIAGLLQHGQALYILLFTVTIIFFCYFYTALVFSPKEMAENLKKSGAFVPGIRPGKQTSQYLEQVVLRLTLFGALYITTICLIPEFLTTALNVPFYLGGTSLLILVVVTMDFSTQINSYRMTQQYESLMSGLDMKSLSRK